jgi:divalent metal cation (Fe/Co/Zn/Cd) transporter
MPWYVMLILGFVGMGLLVGAAMRITKDQLHPQDRTILVFCLVGAFIMGALVVLNLLL